jgi:hypothetical protein
LAAFESSAVAPLLSNPRPALRTQPGRKGSGAACHLGSTIRVGLSEARRCRSSASASAGGVRITSAALVRFRSGARLTTTGAPSARSRATAPA